jgi:hypothetical protein
MPDERKRGYVAVPELRSLEVSAHTFRRGRHFEPAEYPGLQCRDGLKSFLMMGLTMSDTNLSHQDFSVSVPRMEVLLMRDAGLNQPCR